MLRHARLGRNTPWPVPVCRTNLGYGYGEAEPATATAGGDARVKSYPAATRSRIRRVAETYNYAE
eukprot:CAMPEP_0185187172 /NCGR_PEP_ID=MMETSP1140-20130426/4555_1 /TAXON_ID=298111 /ORGANISM="Pavlova sp., Strain CCMP459" /LENGTH=64 /DNA_ID=CAMNT_0027753531 /DNA_START=112 /DNA_END=306 /DNA_ORIENTATION=+